MHSSGILVIALAVWIGGLALAIRHDTYLGVAVLIAVAAVPVFSLTVLSIEFATEDIDPKADSRLLLFLELLGFIGVAAVSAMTIARRRRSIPRMPEVTGADASNQAY